VGTPTSSHLFPLFSPSFHPKALLPLHTNPHTDPDNSSFLFIDINSMPHYRVILHALHNLSFSFALTFTFNNHKTIVEIHYNIDNNILMSSLLINNIYIHSLSSIYLSAYLSYIVKHHCKSVKSIDLTNFTKICK